MINRIDFLISNEPGKVRRALDKLAAASDTVRLVVPFFSESALLHKWLKDPVKLSIVVSLQTPTDPSLLRLLLPYPDAKVQARFYSARLHSKVYLFSKKAVLFAAVVGSSNFTDGGLASNLETNVLITRKEELDILDEHFGQIWDGAALLSPEDVDKYEVFYRKAMAWHRRARKANQEFNGRHVVPKLGKDFRVVPQANNYFRYWKYMDEVSQLVKKESLRAWPQIPVSLTVDHFWHWVVIVWDGKETKRMQKDADYRRKMIPVLFRRFAAWDQEDANYTRDYSRQRRKLFLTLLSRKKLNGLTRSKAALLYRSLHSGSMRTQRFAADRAFARDNSMSRIRKSFAHLLWSQGELVNRISDLMANPAFKLKHFGSSNIQEVLGWVREEFPIRNQKADDAVRQLGYPFECGKLKRV